jgi:hypothetical protein
MAMGLSLNIYLHGKAHVSSAFVQPNSLTRFKVVLMCTSNDASLFFGGSVI